MWSTALIAWRNLSRRKLRTLLTSSMILVGTALIVWSVGLAEGTYNDMISLATRSFAGHFQVVSGDYKDKPTLFKTISDPEPVLRQLAAVDGVEAVTGRAETAGLLSAADKTAGVLLVGVDPVAEPRVTSLDRAVTEGRWFEARPGPTDPNHNLPMVIGAGVAARLKVGLGDELSFIGQAADGSIAAELFTVTGIIDSGGDDVDGVMALVRLADLQGLLVLGKRIHRVVGAATSLNRLKKIERSVSLDPPLRFLPWQEVLPELNATIKGDRAGLWFFLFIILAVVLLGVSNTMMMTVMERTREFGVMMALGSSPGRVIRVIMSEAAWVTALGVGLGLAIGVAANLATAHWGLRIMDEPITYGGVVIDVMTSENTIIGNLIFPALIFTCGLAAGLLPALRAARLKPAAAIREG